MVNLQRTSDYLKKKWGIIFAIISLSIYILLVVTCLVFVSTILLLGLIVVIPLIIVPMIRKDKALFIKRSKATCWALGFLVLFLFPAFWLIPQQIYTRINRQNELITPDAPAVEDFADDFLKEYENFTTMTFEEQADAVCEYTVKEIKWRLDYNNYGLAGHQATPTECIKLGSDDCQGQAVTMASLLLNLGFKYVWVVETPFHWYVLVRDPEDGKLEDGWEKKVEKYQDNGEIITLNRDGEGNMPKWRWEEVVLIFNDEETLYPVNGVEAIAIGWTATAFFYTDIFPLFLTHELIFIILGMFALAIPFTAWTDYMSSSEKTESNRDLKLSKKQILFKVLIISTLLFCVFLFCFLLQLIIWDFTLILAISEISLISVLASEPKFWRLLRIEE